MAKYIETTNVPYKLTLAQNTSGRWVGINLIAREMLNVWHSEESDLKTWSRSLSANFPSVHRWPVICTERVTCSVDVIGPA